MSSGYDAVFPGKYD